MCCAFGIEGTGDAECFCVAAAGEFDLFDVDTSDLFGVCYGPLGVFAAWVKKDGFVHNLSVLNYCLNSGKTPRYKYRLSTVLCAVM